MITPHDTIAAGKAWLRSRLDDGDHCPLCHQMAKFYRRKIHATMAKTLIQMYRSAGLDFVHVPSLPGDTHEASQLGWWNLIEEEKIIRPDGGRAGWWRVTELGEQFVNLAISVPMYAKIYDGNVYELYGDLVTIEDALGTKFRYDDLMRGV